MNFDQHCPGEASVFTDETPAEDAAQFSQGVFQGFGLDVPSGCVSADTSFSKLLDEAFAEIVKGTPAGITVGLELLARAYRLALPRVEKDCGVVVEEAEADLKKAFGGLENPVEILVKIGKNIQVLVFRNIITLQHFKIWRSISLKVFLIPSIPFKPY